MRRRCAFFAGGATALLAGVALLSFTRLTDPDLGSRPRPLGTFDEAERRIRTILRAEARQDLIPEGRSIALLTDARTETAVVIFHGYTSVPKQFQLIAEAYRAHGFNVWVPRLPRHGQTNRMTNGFSKLTGRELRRFADESIDIAAGLGRRVIVVGFSGGGTLAAWSGAERVEVSQTVLISPLLHPLGYPEWAIRPLVRALRFLPFDVYRWWEPAEKDSHVSGYNYPRFSYKGIAALLSLAHWTEDRAALGSYPAQASVVLVRNDGDQRLDSAYNERFVRRVAAPENVRVVRIPASAGLRHNLVSPEPGSEIYAHITEAYAYLADALSIALPSPQGAE